MTLLESCSSPRGRTSAKDSTGRNSTPLFLAFPLAFKGRVVQYVGRLLRTHARKHHVELHDYVDVRIPVLDRMHAKRLPAYASLGFDIPKKRPRTPTPRVLAPIGKNAVDAS